MNYPSFTPAQQREARKAFYDRTVFLMLRGYTDAMLWANTYDSAGVSRDARNLDIGRDAIRQATRDVKAFLRDIEAWHPGTSILGRREGDTNYFAAQELRDEWERYSIERGAESAGHDFALSRNGHGAGFFSRDDGYPALQFFAKRYGPAHWRVNRAGKVSTL